MAPPVAEKHMRAERKTCSEANGTWAGFRETNLHSGLGRTFFLTSLFIDLLSGPCRAVSALDGKWVYITSVVKVDELLQALDVAVVEELLLEVGPWSFRSSSALRWHHGHVACGRGLHFTVRG